MKKVRVSLKNYRCFSDSEPAQFEVGPGFTAIVGPNNSGKSTAKLVFYELREIFQYLAHSDVRTHLSYIFGAGRGINVKYQGVTDNRKIFNNANPRSISIEIALLDHPAPAPDTSNNCLTRVVLSCDPSKPDEWKFEAYGTRNPTKNLATVDGKLPVRTFPAVLAHPTGDLDCNDFFDSVVALRDARYYGAFRNAINEGAGSYFDLVVGTSFVELWNSWKTHGIKQNMDLIDQVTEDIRRLFGFQKLEINASIQLKTLMVKVNGKSYRLAELGSGIAQFIMVFGNAAIHRASILLIDEPETNLHPTLQQDFLLSLGSYARDGVIFSTHSIGLARAIAQPIFSIQKSGEKVSVRPFEATPNYTEFVGELSFSAFRDLGCDKILLVEGVNDVRMAQQLLRLCQKDHSTMVLPLGGDQLASGGREFELGELTRLSTNLFALVDSEREGADAEPIENRKKFAEVCKKLGIRVCVTARRAIENYFTDEAIKAALGSSYSSQVFSHSNGSKTAPSPGARGRIGELLGS